MKILFLFNSAQTKVRKLSNIFWTDRVVERVSACSKMTNVVICPYGAAVRFLNLHLLTFFNNIPRTSLIYLALYTDVPLFTTCYLFILQNVQRLIDMLWIWATFGPLKLLITKMLIITLLELFTTPLD